MSILTVPDDISLEILRYLELRDVPVLLATCRYIRFLFSQRVYWIVVLQNARTSRPLPAPSHTELSKYDLAGLKSLAFQRLRMDRNWSFPFPCIIGKVKVISCDKSADIISSVPGTDIILLHTPQTGRLACWDLNGVSFNLDNLPVGGTVIAISQPYENSGEYVIALLLSGHGKTLVNQSHSIHVIQIRHEAGRAASLREIYYQVLEADLRHLDVFLYEDVVGVIQQTTGDDVSCLVKAINMRSNHVVTLNTQLHYIHWQVGCYVQSGHVYLISEDVSSLSSSTLHHISRKDLPYAENLGCILVKEASISSRVVPKTSPSTDISIPVGILASNVAYGITVISVRHCQYSTSEPNASSPFNTFIRFRLNTPPSNDIDSVPQSGKVDATITLPGTIHISLCGLYLMNIGHSGTGLISIMDMSGQLSLQLVRYVREIGTISVHELQLPPCVDLRRIRGIGLDDYQGKVYLMSNSGVFFSIPYA